MVFKHTVYDEDAPDEQFENDVKEYGFQTLTAMFLVLPVAFENDVKEYGFQTFEMSMSSSQRLRMM